MSDKAVGIVTDILLRTNEYGRPGWIVLVNRADPATEERACCAFCGAPCYNPYEPSSQADIDHDKGCTIAAAFDWLEGEFKAGEEYRGLSPEARAIWLAKPRATLLSSWRIIQKAIAQMAPDAGQA